MSSEDCTKAEWECPPRRSDCWEGDRTFYGGSVPWKESEQQPAEATEDVAPPCTWSKCPWYECPKFSCFGPFDKEQKRPPCKERVECPKRRTKRWCHEAEGTLLPHCRECKRFPYDCSPPPTAPPYPCPLKPRRRHPLYHWEGGIPHSLYAHEPYPRLPDKILPPTLKPMPCRDLDLCAKECAEHTREPYRPCAKPSSEKPPCAPCEEKVEYSCKAAFPDLDWCWEPPPHNRCFTLLPEVHCRLCVCPECVSLREPPTPPLYKYFN